MELHYGVVTLILMVFQTERAIRTLLDSCQQPTYTILENGVRQLCKAKQKSMQKITINICIRGVLVRLTSYTIYNQPSAILGTTDIRIVKLEEGLNHLQLEYIHARQTHYAMNLYLNITLTGCGIAIIIQVRVVLIYNSEAKLGIEFFFKVQVKDTQTVLMVLTQQIH